MDIHVVVNWQQSQTTDQYHMTVLQAQLYNSLRWHVFFKLLTDQLFFNWSKAQVHND